MLGQTALPNLLDFAIASSACLNNRACLEGPRRQLDVMVKDSKRFASLAAGASNAL